MSYQRPGGTSNPAKVLSCSTKCEHCGAVIYADTDMTRHAPVVCDCGRTSIGGLTIHVTGIP